MLTPIALGLSMVVFATVLNSVGIVVERSISEWGIGKGVGGTLEGCKDLTIAASSLFLASRVPSWGYRRVIRVGLGAVGAACLLLALVERFWTVPILFVACGASFALVKVAVYAAVGLIAPEPAAHATAMNRLEGVYQVGALAAPLVFAEMIARGNWLWTYWLVAGLAGLALALWLVTPLPEPEPVSRQGGSAMGDVRTLLGRGSVRLFLVGAAVYVMIEQSLGTWLPTFNTEVFQLPPEEVARLLSLYFGSVALSRFLFGWMVRFVSPLRLQLLLLGSAFAILSGVLVSTRGGPGGRTLVYLLSSIGFFIGPIYPTLCSLMLSRLEKPLQSAMTGLIIVASALGGTVGSQLLGLLSESFTTHAAFHFPLLPILVLAGLLVALQDQATGPTG